MWWIPFYYPVKYSFKTAIICRPCSRYFDLCSQNATQCQISWFMCSQCRCKQKWNLPAGCHILFCMANIISPSKQVRSFTLVERRQELLCQHSTNLAYMFSIQTSPWHCQMFCLALHAGRARKKIKGTYLRVSESLATADWQKSIRMSDSRAQAVDPVGITSQAWIVQSMLI